MQSAVLYAGAVYLCIISIKKDGALPRLRGANTNYER